MAKCPNCGAKEIKKLQLVYEEGTSDFDGITYGVSARGENGVGVTVGSSQTLLAEEVSPPSKKTVAAWAIWFFVSLLLALNRFLPQNEFFPQGGLFDKNSQGFTIFGIFGMIIFSGFAYTAWQFNTEEWPGLYKEWSKRWICLKCGKIFKND
ncbi:MAG TPA: hypothetical protein VHE12_02960 [bacterium]|nr:hypothetical protein [bacterium]